MNKETEDLIIAHMISEYPKEACGLLLENGGYFPCENVRGSGEEFKISGEQWADAEELSPIVGVVHSHPDWVPVASEADRVMCEATGIPWHIYTVRGGPEGPYFDGSATITPGGYVSPLVGRSFHYGVLDCYTLVRDYYRREFDIDLGDYDCPEDWWNTGGDFYRELLPKAGMVQLEGLPSEIELQEGDVILMMIKAPVPNHAAVYLKSGTLKTEPDLYPTPGSILHHMYDQDSRRDVYGGYWLKNTVSVWRHHARQG